MSAELARRLDSLEPRVTAIETKVNSMETASALASQKMDMLMDQVSTGMTDLKGLTQEVSTKYEEQLREDREARQKQRQAEREDSRWWWTKVFGIVTTLLTLAGGGAGAYYYAQPPAVSAPATAIHVETPESTP